MESVMFPQAKRLKHTKLADDELSLDASLHQPDNDNSLTAGNPAHSHTPSDISASHVQLSHEDFVTFSDVYTWGTGLHGELGRKAAASEKSASVVPELQGISVKKLALGDKRGIALSTDGQVYTWGRCFGKSIDDNERYRPRMYLWSDLNPMPVPLSFKIAVEDVVCGFAHAMLICEQGYSLYAMGSNKHGQLGTGTEISTSTPELVKFVDVVDVRVKILKVALGKFHSLVLAHKISEQDGQTGIHVYSWGRGSTGAHGQGTFGDVRKPKVMEMLDEQKLIASDISAGTSHSAILTTTGEAYVCGNFGVNVTFNTLRKIQIPSEFKVKTITSGTQQVLFLNGNSILS
jgi:alpha-tubulin suppressor-like RCC1 family protein